MINFCFVFYIISDQWKSPTVKGDRPPPIYGFTLSAINNNTGILFGGTVDGKTSSDVYIFEFTRSSVVRVII